MEDGLNSAAETRSAERGAVMDWRQQSVDLRKAYFTANGRWELGLVDLCVPLGNILLECRDSGRPVNLRDPKIRRELRWLTPRIQNWLEKYREWREEQGNPLHGNYAELPAMKAPFLRIVAAAKEYAYRTEQEEKDLARVALRDLVQASEDYARYLRVRQEGKRLQAAAEARKAEVAVAVEGIVPDREMVLQMVGMAVAPDKEMYCFKCRQRTASRGLQEVVLKNRSPAVTGNCAACGSKKFRFTSVRK